MGIRYYAYAFDGDVTDLALADPRRFLSSDPLADGWDSWLRVLTPGEMAAVSQDLNRISENDLRQRLPAVPRADQESEVSYAAHYLQQAKSFVSNLVTSGRGMVYLIG